MQDRHGGDLNYKIVVAPLQDRQSADLHYKTVVVVAPLVRQVGHSGYHTYMYIQDGVDSGSLQDGGGFLREDMWRSNLQDGGSGDPLQDIHGADLNNKMVLVLASCRRDKVADLKYRMVVVLAPSPAGGTWYGSI